mmetsp:Transcript_44738/g.76079  ORF Transcript_44738/g.76079 Transcript_44738/m.76079 type:complete len:434 (-) Transcript_44738:178-1479(-)
MKSAFPEDSNGTDKRPKLTTFIDIFKKQNGANSSREEFTHIFDIDSSLADIETAPEPSTQSCEQETHDLVTSCWKMRAIRRTLTGGFLTSDIFVPPGMYIQPGARLIGLSLKIEIYETLNSKLALFLGDTKGGQPSRDSSQKALLQALESLNSIAADISLLHDRLHRSFPSFVVERVKSDAQSETEATAAAEETAAPNALNPRLKTEVASKPATELAQGAAPVARLWGVAGLWGAAAGKAAIAVGRTAVAIGRSAAEASTEIASAAGKTALSAYERAKNVLPEKMTEESAVRFVRAIDAVCEGAQVFGLWGLSLAGDGTQDEKNCGEQGKSSEGKESTLRDLEAALALVGRFLDCAVVELLVRDLETLLELHNTQVVKSFTDLDWDLDNATIATTGFAAPPLVVTGDEGAGLALPERGEGEDEDEEVVWESGM